MDLPSHNNYRILESFFDVTKIPLILMNKLEIVKTIPETIPLNPAHSSIRDHLIACNIQGDAIKLIDTNYYETFISIPFLENEQQFWLIVGPVTYSLPTKSSINRLVERIDSKELEEEYEEYLLSLHRVNRNQLIEAANVAFYLLRNVQLNIRELLSDITTLEKNIDRKISDYITEIREYSLHHHDPILERHLYQLIEDGNTNEIISYYRAFMGKNDFTLGVLSKKSLLRSDKNISIATITLATRAAIRGGVHPEDAYSLGDIMIQELEELNTIEKTSRYREEILYKFAETVARHKKQKYPKKISICQDYIYKHIYDEDLSLKTIALSLQINPKYLSNLFKKKLAFP